MWETPSCIVGDKVQPELPTLGKQEKAVEKSVKSSVKGSVKGSVKSKK